ncbi:hypothetical protein DFJ73DRAFT_779146 [Zopfochytrium polystomum]|nr:hypothetical protein DFJ73DRAFT_779146 [Zopfochytrium polystomum]
MTNTPTWRHPDVRSILSPDRRPFKSGFVGYLSVANYYNPSFGWPSSDLHFFNNNIDGKSAMLIQVSDTQIHWVLYKAKQEDISHDD